MLLNEKLWQVAQGRLSRLLISMPPRHGKSLLASHYFPAWYLGTFPERRVLMAGYEADFAASWGRKARDTLKEFGPSVFGVQLAAKSAAADRWQIAKFGGGMQTAGIGGPLTGKGADLLLIDDPLKNDEEAANPRHRAKIWEWFQATAYTRLEPQGAIVIIMTRWHRDDLVGRLLQLPSTGGEHWEHVNLPALATEEDDALGRTCGEPLWPERFNQQRLEQIRATIGEYFFASLYQQNPRPEGGTEWPESYFPASIWFEDWPTELTLKVLALDPSKGKEADWGDYSAIVFLGLSPDGTFWVDADLARRPIAEMLDETLDWFVRWQPHALVVETNQFQELLAGELQRLAAERGLLQLPLVPMNNTLSKITRLRTLGPYLTQRAFRFRANSPGAKLLVEQLKDFPRGQHDDGPDALEMALRVARQWLAAGDSSDPLSGWQQLRVG